MSERHFNKFVTKYRPEETQKLALLMKNDCGSYSKHSPAEYERLQAILDSKRQESDLIGQKFQSTLSATKASKESSMLRQHRQVWSKDHLRLQNAEKKAENEIQDFLRQIRPSSTTDTAVFSLLDYEMFLETERDTFKVATVDPVLQLKEDLCFRLREERQQQQHYTRLPSNCQQVVQQINFVKDQQNAVIDKLHSEYQAIEEELVALDLEDILTTTSGNVANIEEIPQELLDSDCPDPNVKQSLLQKFIFVSQVYQDGIKYLQQQLQETDRFCGWCADDHLRFQFTVEQYTHDVDNHRVLFVDMLQRLFPAKTRQELMEHERVWVSRCSTETQLKALTHQWQRDREELLASALITLQEARRAHQEQLARRRDHQHQQAVCSHLRDKVQQWRFQQEEVAKQEEALAAQQQEEHEARLKEVQEKEEAIRSQKKEKVRLFYLKQQRRREIVEQREEERLANLRRVMEDQAKRDKERVQLRADLLQRRREAREAQELKQQREEEERLHRLDALRNQVAVLAKADPQRMMRDTEAWRGRHSNEIQSDLQKPLFTINTYTDAQIVSDIRVRVEQAFREAGLHHTQCAKEALALIKPPKPPRKDATSTFNF
ncbi:coiled-coil domain-containing protein 148-like [Thalassophryne amazonica]|uniref:coiled-coil domain-containing protein 148-like n=1 Tax=Thalassophryne amazonica TaxID=390379 RepID=UPI001471248A|nr:coiled-coil domain-containing protein 148-like [Thalassophryne amazonica]